MRFHGCCLLPLPAFLLSSSFHCRCLPPPSILPPSLSLRSQLYNNVQFFSLLQSLLISSFCCPVPLPPARTPKVLPAPDGLFYSVNFLMNVAVSQLCSPCPLIVFWSHLIRTSNTLRAPSRASPSKERWNNSRGRWKWASVCRVSGPLIIAPPHPLKPKVTQQDLVRLWPRAAARCSGTWCSS